MIEPLNRAAVLLVAAGTILTVAAEARGQVTVTGRVRYTGRAGAESAAGSYQFFPSRQVRVELYDRNEGGFDVLLGETWTDDSGNYTFASVSNVETDMFPPDTASLFDPYIKVYTESRPVLPAAGGVKSRITVNRPGALAGTLEPVAGSVYDFATPEQLNPMGNVTINQDFGSGNDTARAFSVYDSFQTITRYHSTLPGSNNNTIAATYPTPMNTSNFSSGLMHILAGDQYDWDVVAHEYGHYVQSLYSLENSPGGNHSPGFNLRYSRGPGGSDGPPAIDRRRADRLAWGEGHATWFGTRGQEQQNAAGLGVQRAGDAIYNDNNDADGTTQGLRFGIENQAIGGRPSRGEDDEAAVARILYDLADNTNDPIDHDRVSLGDNAIHTMIKDNATHTLSSFWNVLVTGANNKTKIDYGAIFMAHNAAAMPDWTSVSAATYDPFNDPVPEFRWFRPRGGDGASGFANLLFHDFQVRIFDSTYTEVWASGWLGNVASWTPDLAAWQAIPGGHMHWIVESREQTNEPFGQYTTGSYWSDELDFGLVPAPGAVGLAGLAGLALGRRRRR